MRSKLRAISARLIVGHLDSDSASELMDVIEPRGKPAIFALAEPEGIATPATVSVGAAGGDASDVCRLGKLVIETVANEYTTSSRTDPCDALVDGLRMAHRHLGPSGLDLVIRGGSGVGFCAATVVGKAVQLVIVPPSQAFILHQGGVHALPEAHELGRGIWMRDDLRAEMFAGVGGNHEPEIRIYESTVGPGDTVVLLSSALARMLSEEDVRRAMTYEEAAVAADHLRDLALQRGVEGGLALVIEIAASLAEEEEGEPEQPSPRHARPSIASNILHSSSAGDAEGKREMPPIGSVFMTARDRLLEAFEHTQPKPSQQADQKSSPKAAADDDDDIPWPKRPRPGKHLASNQSATPAAVPQPTWVAEPRVPAVAESVPATVRKAADVPTGRRGAPLEQDHRAHSGAPAHPRQLSQRGSAFAKRLFTQIQVIVKPAASTEASPHVSRYEPEAGNAPSIGSGRSMVGRLSAPRLPKPGNMARQAAGTAQHIRQSLVRIPALGKRGAVLPAAVALLAFVLVIVGVRTVQAQQQHQLDQRFTSLVSAAQQLETQANGSSDHTQAQNLVHQAQALLDQAATMKHDQAPVTTLRKTLLIDLDKQSNILQLPDPTVMATFDGSSKDAGAIELAGDTSTLYVLDSGQQKIFQVMRVQKTKTAVVSKGDQVGQNQLAAPQLIASADAGTIVILDSEHRLWQYVPSKNALGLVGLKGTESWKSVQDIASYGGNVYVLDAAGGNIFRYVPKDGQYVDAPSRFFDTDNKVPLTQAISITIDGSIWVLRSDGQILKMAGGQGQTVPITGLPQAMVKPATIFTTADLHSLYVLDAGSNRVIQLGKDGAYQRELNLSLPQPAKSLWVDESNRALYVLANNTLYAYQMPL